MKIYLLLALFVCLDSIPTFAQHEADNWYFGDHIGMNFQNSLPTYSGGSQLNSEEASATVSDKTTGKLLFYTDGSTVWNAKHAVVKNGTGLMGGPSSTQGALIIGNPRDTSEYYIFTVPDLTGGGKPKTTAMYYSLLSLANPDGEIIIKNKILVEDVSEKLTGTVNCAEQGYWVIAHHRTQNTFYSFHITKQGVNETPVVSNYTERTLAHTQGYMKLSPDGKKLALASTHSKSFLALFDFNRLTGEVTNYSLLSNPATGDLFYGVAFSPDNSKLYALGKTSLGRPKFNCALFQYDLQLPTRSEIQNSELYYFVRPNTSFVNSALQLAPNGKIYIATSGSSLEVINQPNLRGIDCDYQTGAMYFSTSVKRGLPNFLDYVFNTSDENSPITVGCKKPIAVTYPDSGCIGETLMYVDSSKYNPTHRRWTFENGSPSTSEDSIVLVSYRQSGIHNVSLVVSNGNGDDTISTEAIIFPSAVANAGFDKVICQGESVQLGDKPEAGNKYEWQPITNLDNPAIANPIVTPDDNSQYILTVTSSNGCVARDTVLVSISEIIAKISSDTAICTGSKVQLFAGGGSNYLWSPGIGLNDSTIENPIASPSMTTTYKVVVSSGECMDSAFVKITIHPQPVANAGQDITICSGAGTEIGENGQTGFTYSWHPAFGLDDATKPNPHATPTITTQYILMVTGIGGCIATDTILVTVENITVIASNDTGICEHSSVELFASGGNKYDWTPDIGLNDATIANPIASPTFTTKYKVNVTNGTCLDSAFVTVTIVRPPHADAGEDNSICIGDSIQIGAQSDVGNLYSWTPTNGLVSPNSSQTIAYPSETTTYSLRVTNPTGCTGTDEVVVTVNPKNERSFTLYPDTVIIVPGNPFVMRLNIPSGVSDWKVRLQYDPLLIKFNSLTGGRALSDDFNGELTISGSGGSSTSTIGFDAFLPYATDTIYPVKLSVDPAHAEQCDTWSAVGNTLKLAEYCGKNIRVVSGTGKKYYLTVRNRSIDFGVGLSGNVRLEVFDYIGNSVVVISDGRLEAGEYSTTLDLPVGVYYCRMRAGMYESVVKINSNTR